MNTSLPVFAFDVYGTLIDPFGMASPLRQAFGKKAVPVAALWRSKQLEYSFRRGLMRKYVNFDVCTAQALEFAAAQMRVTLSATAKRRLLDAYLRLRAYPDAVGAIRMLQEQGVTLVACSNGTERSLRSLLKHASILGKFRTIISVDRLQTFKPNPAVYNYLARRVRRPKRSVWMISSNPFDVIGAKASGLRAVWVRRNPKAVFDPWEFKPDLVIGSLTELSDRLRRITHS